MRKIFPKSSSSGSCSASSAKPPLRKDASAKPGLVKRQEEVNLRNRREHWCPACPSGGGEIRCETPPSGDENAKGTNQNIPHTRLGLPEECQDKQIVRPSIKGVTKSRSSSPEHGTFEWTSGLQNALDQLVEESRQEPIWKNPSDPPSPASSPPPMEKQRRRRDHMTSNSSIRPGSVCSDQSVNQRTCTKQLLPPSEDVNPVKLSRSRSSNSGASIMSNPRSQSFGDWTSRGTTSDNFSHHAEYSADDLSRDRSSSQSRYLSARVVAEKLVKVMRGSSKVKDSKRPPPFPKELPTEFKKDNNEFFGKDPKHPSPQEATEFRKDNEFFRRQLDSHDGDLSFVFDSLEDRVTSAEKLFMLAEAEFNSADVLHGEKNSGKFNSRELDRHEALNRKIKKLQKDRKELAREVLSEVRLRSMERITVREVLGFMKRDTEFWLKSLERDKADLQTKLEDANAGGDEAWLRERVKKFAEEKEKVERDLIVVTARENALRQKVRDFETQMQGHIARVEGTQRTIVELKESVATGQRKLVQSEQDVEHLRKELQLERQRHGRARNDEVLHLRRLLEGATEKAMKLESQVRDKDQQLNDLRLELRQRTQEVTRYRHDMSIVSRERDGLKLEADEMGREALRTSAEAEVLRRRVHQLEEDVMLKEGQLSIMRGSLDNDESL